MNKIEKILSQPADVDWNGIKLIATKLLLHCNKQKPSKSLSVTLGKNGKNEILIITLKVKKID